MSRRPAILLCAGLAPFGWLLFWAVFHTVPGQDWVVFHTAGSLYFADHLALLADPHGFTDELNRSHAAWFVHPLLFHPWVYPPVTLLLAIAFGWLPYGVSLWAFIVMTLALLIVALRVWATSWVEHIWLVVSVLACPATAFCIGAGQLSFFIAACVVAGIALLPSRPVLAGCVLSLVSLKPQFAFLVPVALLAGGHWRGIAGGLAGGCALILASILVAGVSPWQTWLYLATGGNPDLSSLIQAVRLYDQSVHTCLVVLGASASWAGIGQGLAMTAAAVCTWRAFARPAPARTRLVVLLCALVFGAPHVGDYDHVLLAIAATLLLIEGPLVWLPAGVWLATMFNPPALIAALGIPALTYLSALSVLLGGSLMLRATPWSK